MQAEKKYFSDLDLCHRYGVHRTTPWRWVRQGKFPKPVNFNGSTRWHIDKVLEWERSHQEKTQC